MAASHSCARSALKEIANSKLRRLLAYNITFGCVDIKVGDLVPVYKAPQPKSNPRWRGPAAILDIDESGATLEFQSQYSKVTRYCVRRKVEEKDLPQGPAACDNPMKIGWDMSQPLFARPPEPDLLANEEAPSDLTLAAPPVDGAEEPPETATVGAGVSDSAVIPGTASS